MNAFSPLLALFVAVLIANASQISYLLSKRSVEALELGSYLQNSTYYGPCHRGRSILNELPDAVCASDVELLKHRWRFSLWTKCMNHHFHQPAGVSVEVSIVMTVHNKIHLAMQALTELAIHGSRELGAFEFIVLDDGSSSSPRPMKRMLEKLQNQYGIKATFLRNKRAVRIPWISII